MRRPVVLVTGASTGLGLAIARRLRKSGKWTLILTARASSLGRFADAGITEDAHTLLRRLDVTSAAQRRAVVGEAEGSLGGLDVLINNAGVSTRSVVEHVTERDRLSQMDINFRSPMELTRLALPGMRRRRRGRIINVSSVGGMMAMPTMAVYSASKFALEGACEAMWYELRPWGVHVSLIEPGFINSDGFEKVRWTEAGQAAVADPAHPYHRHYRDMTSFITRIMGKVPSTPDAVAAKVERVMMRRDPPLRVPATIDAWLFSLVRRVLPRRLYHAALYASLPGVSGWGPRGALEEEWEESATEDLGW
jgi:NAD(P)-dependent dehydrogenase (short-subunit alcohol dehydrogenase family)